MKAVKMDRTVDKALADALPPLRPMLGKRVLLIALESEEGPARTDRQAGIEKVLTLEEFLEHRLKRPEGVAPLSLEDMEQAIIRGAPTGLKVV